MYTLPKLESNSFAVVEISVHTFAVLFWLVKLSIPSSLPYAEEEVALVLASRLQWVADAVALPVRSSMPYVISNVARYWA